MANFFFEETGGSPTDYNILKRGEKPLQVFYKNSKNKKGRGIKSSILPLNDKNAI